MVDNSEYLAYAQPAASGGDLSSLQNLAEQQAAAEAEVAKAEAALNRAKEVLKDLAERQVPDAMEQVGLSEFKTATGLVIKIDEIIRASIPNPQLFAALAWLKAHNHSALIKRSVVLNFGKGEDDKADKLLRELVEQGLEPTDKAGVHPQTLGAFVREKLEKGEEVPLDLFGVFRQRVARIKT